MRERVETQRRGVRRDGVALCGLSASAFLLSSGHILISINQLTHAILGAAIQVHKALGPGLLESAYRVCLAHELEQRGFEVVQEQPIPLVYENTKLECGFRADLWVARQVIVECKAKEKVHPVDRAQVLSHLRLMQLQVGLLINFHEVVLKDGIQRIVNHDRER